jgi:C-terminal processing protease CtpA/Prc
VFFDNVYEVNGHKIGYLVYNFFASGPTYGNFSYDKNMNEAFGRFKSAGITELVLDLRYNSGGLMNSATLLGSMIVPDLDTNNVFAKHQYNSLFEWILVQEGGEDALVDKLRYKLTTKEGEVYKDNTGDVINNVGNTIQSLYVLTSGWTASASEMIINNLKPYMPVVLIGNTTVGKNEGSITLYEKDDPKNKWGMQPIVLRYFNKDGQADFLNGFAPDIRERDNYLNHKLPLGDPNEVMLKIAIDHITGNYVPVPTITSRSGVGGRITVGSSVEQKAWAGRTIVDDALFRKLNIER